ncbi:MAG: YbaB/EbfC family nucleoid-associated protein [Bacilli bacterium]|nr:YbaB/EbfC family nucleoid-associated protein [Bacilli bacterium]
MNPGMIKKLQKMQKDMVNAQKELEASTFYGSAGGQMVKVEFTGDRKMKNIVIQGDAMESLDDLELLQDTIVAAVNDCIKKIDDETESVMSQFTGGGMPGLF